MTATIWLTYANPIISAWNDLLASLFLWLPVVYGAYILGRRQFSLASFFVFLTVECIAVGRFAWKVAQWWANQEPFGADPF